MTLGEKVAQLGGAWFGRLLSGDDLDDEKLEAALGGGIGHITCIATDSFAPPELTSNTLCPVLLDVVFAGQLRRGEGVGGDAGDVADPAAEGGFQLFVVEVVAAQEAPEPGPAELRATFSPRVMQPQSRPASRPEQPQTPAAPIT